VIPKLGDSVKLNPSFVAEWENNHGKCNWLSKLESEKTLEVLNIRTTMNDNIVVTISFKDGGAMPIELKNTGSFYNFVYGPTVFIKCGTSNADSCLICKASGEIVFNKFYCTNLNCQNFHK